MNLNINLGQDIFDNEVFIDLNAKQLNFILLVGTTGSGKSVFHNNLYKELSERNTPEEVGFVFLDMTRVDFMHWKSPYLSKPQATGDEAMDVLEKLAKESISKTLFVHIEECDLLVQFPERIKQVLTKLLKNENIYIVFSTSRPSKEDVLRDWLMNIIDLKVVFNLASLDDCETLGVNNEPLKFKPGERLLAYDDQTIACKPFSADLTNILNNFELVQD